MTSSHDNGSPSPTEPALLSMPRQGVPHPALAAHIMCYLPAILPEWQHVYDAEGNPVVVYPACGHVVPEAFALETCLETTQAPAPRPTFRPRERRPYPVDLVNRDSEAVRGAKKAAATEYLALANAAIDVVRWWPWWAHTSRCLAPVVLREEEEVEVVNVPGQQRQQQQQQQQQRARRSDLSLGSYMVTKGRRQRQGFYKYFAGSNSFPRSDRKVGGGIVDEDSLVRSPLRSGNSAT